MNYLAHGRRHLDRPWVLAGTALPDWLRVVDKRARLRVEALRALELEPQSIAHQLREGVIAHHDDDEWFHTDAAFESITHDVVHELRKRSTDPRFRASTIGHVMVEMLVDAALCERDPTLAPRYYDALDQLDRDTLVAYACAWTQRELLSERMPILFDRFRRSRFLFMYVSDDGVADALSGVMMRVGVATLADDEIAAVSAWARPRVREWVARGVL